MMAALPLAFLLSLWMPWAVLGYIPPNGVCDLNVMLPFSVRLDRTGAGEPMSTGFFTQSRLYSLGYSHLAAAVMAMKHFNERDGRIAPELEQLGDCPIQFSMNQSNFLDTGTFGMLGNTLVFQKHQERQSPICAIAGPFYELPARNLATMAAAAQVPHMPHRGYSMGLSMYNLAPMTTLATIDQLQIAQALVSYLYHIGRDNFVSFLHPLTDMGVQGALVQGVAFNMYGLDQWEEFGYLSELFDNNDVDRDIATVMTKVKQRGFRTIVVTTLDTWLVDLPALANEAEANNMLNGDYVWIFIPIFEKAAIHNAIQLSDYLLNGQGIASYANVTKLLRGAALLTDIEEFHYKGDQDPFLRAWKAQGPEMVQLVNDMYMNRTTQQGGKDYLMAPSYFQTFSPEDGSGRLYDSIMAIGIGACQAERDELGAIQGMAHRDAIRQTKFTGATGSVEFGDWRTNFTKSQIRRPETTVFGLYNLYPPSINQSKPDADKYSTYEEAFVLTEILTELKGPRMAAMASGLSLELDSGGWTKQGPAFVFANGRIEPPILLRDVPDQNYLAKHLRIVGLTLMGLSLFLCAISFVFVVCNWTHRVIRASQPWFLCLLLFGAAVTSLAILTVSFDESYGWTEEALSTACMATPWLFCCGHIITYGALFSKLWRVNKVLQFTRRKISATAVAGPMMALLFATVVVLTAWTIHDPLVWVRTVVDEFTGESIAQCDSDSGSIYVPLLAVVVAIPTVLTCVMAYKTKDVDETFTESSWIFTLIILQIQVIMVSIPIYVILRGTSTDGRYMGLVILISCFPISTVIFIMGPKFVAYFQQSGLSAASSRTSEARRSRGASGGGGVRVSGISGLSGGTNSEARNSQTMEAAFVCPVPDGDSKRVSFAPNSDNKFGSSQLASAR